MDIIRYILNFAVFFITNVCGLFSYVMWTTTLLPMRFLWPDIYWKIESFLFRALQAFVVLWMVSGKYGVVESGEDISGLVDKGTVLLANHQSTADTPLVMLALWPKGRVSGNVMWIMDRVFQFTNFGIISTIRQDFFIRQGKETRELQSQLLSTHLKDVFLPQGRKWIVLFPEGGFLRKRIESSHSYAKKNGYPLLHKVTLPRIGALKAIIDTIGAPTDDVTELGSGESMPNGNCGAENPERPLKWLIDMTIAYRSSEGSPPDMFGMCVGYRVPQDMHVHYQIYPLSAVPRDSESMLKWLYTRYEEKEKMMEFFEAHGHFPPSSREGQAKSEQPRRLLYDWISIAMYLAFFLSSTYLHYTCIVSPLLNVLF